MKNLNRYIQIAVMILGCSAIATPSYAVKFSKSEKSKLIAGKTVRQPLAKSGQRGFFGGSGYAVIDAPPEAVWAAIKDWASYKKMFPKTVGAKELARQGDSSLVKIEQGYKMLSVSYHMNVVQNAQKKMVSFNLVKNKPHDIEDAHGYWRLFPQKDGRTLVAYVVAVKVPMGIVNFIGEDLAKQVGRALLNVPGSLKKWMESPQGSRYRTLTAKN